MKLALVGDTHGNARWMNDTVIPFAVKNGATTIVQLGDFGFVFPAPNYLNTLAKLDRSLGRSGVELLFLPGNHEDHTKLAKIEADADRTSEGHFRVSDHITYTGRCSSWKWAGKRLAAVGGAVSIDRKWRQREMRQRPDAAPIWWAEEVLSADELATARGFGPVDVLFTHDAPTSFPSEWLVPDLESTVYRQAMTDIGRALTPKIWAHGHYHAHHVYPFHHARGMCEVTALDCDGSAPGRGMVILDLERDHE